MQARHDDDMGMDMDGDAMACSMHMLGNWQTIGACFLTSSWRISTEAQFAGTCIGVFLLVVLVESVRRWGREWDRYILASALARRRDEQRVGNMDTRDERRQSAGKTEDGGSLEAAAVPELNAAPAGAGALARLESVFYGLPRRSAGARTLRRSGPRRFRPTVLQQTVRSLVYATQFAGAYIVMLLAMSFNGYLLIAIVLGGLFGHFFATWDTLAVPLDEDEHAGPVLLREQHGSSSGACCG
ncbi:Ctr copper transporter [Tilletiopsis washingtonensis]|uniref:Copper transport protein n=1 Tax=Tilletiopsis washingtonensis TaxID=58919 RepID=A0A316Z441_9BASI|nr:Ctr copper transporter [Tilletiopsis washingtonensis]PWN94965.1 Ctr copper transporter [Tilletiopsis washingtonensis]